MPDELKQLVLFPPPRNAQQADGGEAYDREQISHGTNVPGGYDTLTCNR